MFTLFLKGCFFFLISEMTHELPYKKKKKRGKLCGNLSNTFCPKESFKVVGYC